MSRRIGIMGGTFNPPHTGHAIIASHIIEQENLDLLLMMVTPQNPFKQNVAMASDMHRLLMTQMLTARIDKAETSAFEMSLPKPNYTINTLKALQEKFPDDELILIIGADNWEAWDRWKDPEEIIKNFRVIVYPRMGARIEIAPEYNQRVKIVDAPIIELSSTAIRQKIKMQQSIAFLVPHDVEKYIINKKLYK